MSDTGNDIDDPERNRLDKRLRRYAGVGAAGAGFVSRAAASRLTSGAKGSRAEAQALKAALGGLKGPLMKAAQLIATIPDAVPPEYADELMELQTNAPAMGRAFVRRRMRAELGPDWRAQFEDFDEDAVAAASLGQVHKARADGRDLAVKLQYPDMSSAVEADLKQLDAAFGVFRRFSRAIDPSEIKEELADRLREELDYERERRNIALYADMLAGEPTIRTPEPLHALSTRRLLTMTWLEGEKVTRFADADQDTRNAIARNLFRAWWVPFGRYGIIHGDPHLGNYAACEEGAALNLLDFGCIRIFDGAFVEAVLTLREAIRTGNRDLAADAYRVWGFKSLSNELIDTLNIWAEFIYGPLLEDRTRTVAEDVSPGAYGRAQAFAVHQKLKEIGPVAPPRRFVFMDRAAIGLGSVFIRLNAKLNFYALFEDALQGFETAAVDARRKKALEKAAALKTS